MKVVLINHSDTLGGASVVTFRLMEALRREGIDASMLVVHKASGNDNVALAGNAFLRKFCFLAEHARIFASSGFTRRNLFKISVAEDGLPLSRHPLVRDADAVLLNWINQGMLSLDEIEQIASLKPVLWTMHDMWCMTGVCHHAGDCDGYRHSCGKCPLISRTPTVDDLSHRTWLRKRRTYSRVGIHFIAVSNWLAARSAESSLLSSLPVSVIHNAFPVEDFPAPQSRTAEVKRIIMGAARLDDPIKDFPLAVEALNIVAEHYKKPVEAVFFGSIRRPELFTGLRMPYRHVGTVSASDSLAALYADSKVVLSTSRYETLPGTVIEGMSAGCVPVVTGNGGQRDIVDHLSTGYVASQRTATEIANGIIWALESDISPAMLHSVVEEKFSARSIALKYIGLIKNSIKIYDKESAV